MANYQYGTSPRKLEPKYKTTKKKLEVIKNEPKKNGLSKEEKKLRKKQICLVIAIFALLVTISYSIQDLKEDLSNLEKENKQLEIGIEGSLNLNNIEKIATEQLGMQKQTVGQTIYTELPKEDYVEAATEEIRKERISFFEQFINIFK